MDAAPATSPLQAQPQNKSPLAGIQLDAQQANQNTDAAQQHIAGDEAQMSMMPPAFDTMPPPPEQTDPGKAWASTAMMMAVIGGAFTRSPLTTALTAATGVLNGFHQGDLDASQSSFERWKVANANAAKNYEFAMNRLKADVELWKTNAELGQAKFNADTKAFGMHLDFVKTQDEAQRLLLDAERTADDHALKSELLQQKGQQIEVFNGLKKARTALQQAQQSGNPAAVKQAQDNMTMAVQRAQDLSLSQGKVAGTAITAKLAEEGRMYDTAIGEVDKAINMVKDPNIIGARGMIGRTYEGIKGQFDPSTQTPSRNFTTQLAAIRASTRTLIEKSHFMSGGAREEVEDLVKGLDALDTQEEVKRSLTTIKGILMSQKGESASNADLGSGTSMSNMTDDQLMQALGLGSQQ